MNYLTGKDYGHLCPKCQGAIDVAITAMQGASYEYRSDPEGPCMWVYDHALFCGGRECVGKKEGNE